MGAFTFFRRVCFFSLLLTLPYSIIASATDDVGGIGIDSIDSISSPPPVPDNLIQKSNRSGFKPSVAVVVGVLTTLFSITFLFLLYIKHCKEGTTRGRGGGSYMRNENFCGRKNSGIERVVIESLPVFKFGSLRGQKEGLECAVCLNRFEPSEVLRLLPKCKHAFHVECVDTWLDAHSTCPLCRYRVDPEDILLVEHGSLIETHSSQPPKVSHQEDEEEKEMIVRRMSGRHSSAGERKTGNLLQVRVDRISLDNFGNKNDTVSVGCFERGRKDGLLLTAADRENFQRRFQHRIVVSGKGGTHQRWSDFQPSDLLYLQSEMIISDSRRLARVSGKSDGIDGGLQSGRNVINGRSVSEITGLSRRCNENEQRQRQVGVVSRWLAWISERRSVSL